MSTERSVTRVKVASQIHAEVVSIVALRAFGDCIQDSDTPTVMRSRIRKLIVLKLGLMGLRADDLDEAVNDTALLMERADKIVGDLLAKVKK
jgi:hypothetical protein